MNKIHLNPMHIAAVFYYSLRKDAERVGAVHGKKWKGEEDMSAESDVGGELCMYLCTGYMYVSGAEPPKSRSLLPGGSF